MFIDYEQLHSIPYKKDYCVFICDLLIEYYCFSDFQEHFDSCDKDVATFSNLGGDAHLVVPCPPTESHSASNDKQNYQNIYGHLAAFMKFNQNLDQIHNFWIQVAKTFEEQIQKRREDSPIWLSTCGTGVYWLHVRLDSRPKYYSFQEYRKFH